MESDLDKARRWLDDAMSRLKDGEYMDTSEITNALDTWVDVKVRDLLRKSLKETPNEPAHG